MLTNLPLVIGTVLSRWVRVVVATSDQPDGRRFCHRRLRENISDSVIVRSQINLSLIIHEPLARLRDDRLDRLPDPKEFATGYKEQPFVEQAVVQQSTVYSQ